MLTVLGMVKGRVIAWMPEWSKGADLRSAVLIYAWVQTPLQATAI